MAVKSRVEETYNKTQQRMEAGEKLLQWLERSWHHDYDPESGDPRLRAEQQAYSRGYNDCRAEAMRVVADLVLKQDDDEDDDSGCDCA